MTNRRFSTTILSALVTLGLSSLVGLAPAIAQSRFDAPNLGAPGNREAGSARSGPCTTSDRGLVALLPESTGALTTEAHPEFLVYVPPSSATSGEFVLYEEATGEMVYETILPLPSEPGILSVALPADGTVPALEVGKSYYWYFSVICSAGNRANDLTVQGNIQRINLDSTLASQLENATPSQAAGIYTTAGIWQDAVAILANLNRTNPNDATLQTAWVSLLDSVGLDSLSEEPFR